VRVVLGVNSDVASLRFCFDSLSNEYLTISQHLWTGAFDSPPQFPSSWLAQRLQHVPGVLDLSQPLFSMPCLVDVPADTWDCPPAIPSFQATHSAQSCKQLKNGCRFGL